jgi:hypothetical protein
MMARIGVMRALNGHVERVFDPDAKMTHWGKRKLKRDERVDTWWITVFSNTCGS